MPILIRGWQHATATSWTQTEPYGALGAAETLPVQPDEMDAYSDKEQAERMPGCLRSRQEGGGAGPGNRLDDPLAEAESVAEDRVEVEDVEALMLAKGTWLKAKGTTKQNKSKRGTRLASGASDSDRVMCMFINAHALLPDKQWCRRVHSNDFYANKSAGTSFNPILSYPILNQCSSTHGLLL